MKKAKEVMITKVITLSPQTKVEEAARVFTENNIHGAPVVSETGRLLGMVTESDLIATEVKLHYPSYIQLLAGIIYLEDYRHFDEELKKAVATEVKDVMTKETVVAGEDTPLDEIASLMVENSVDRIPILRDERVAGIIARHDLVKALAGK